MHEPEPKENIHLVHSECSDLRKIAFQTYVEQLLKSDKLQKELAAAVFGGKAYFKAGVTENNVTENMWFNIQSADFVAGTFKGRLDNDPVIATSYICGHTYTLPLTSVLEKML